MRIKKLILLGMVSLLCLPNLSAQDNVSANAPEYVTVTTLHWNTNLTNFDISEWLATEKEFFDKVTSKNDLIMGAGVLMHSYTGDNSEIKVYNVYGSWGDIDAAGAKNAELIKNGWPNEDERKAFMKKRMAYYTDEHSDEIYATGPNAKQPAKRPDKAQVYYIQITKLAFPDDGSGKEFNELMKEANEATIQKNEFIKGYYPNFHAWGADRRDFVQVYVLDSLADLEKMGDRNDELIKEKWSDEEKRKEFGKKYGKYFSGLHGDYIYVNVPELMK